MDTLLVDLGYDAEYNHQFCCEEFGIHSTVIQINDRNLKYGRTQGRHHRCMKQRFLAASYQKCWHIESSSRDSSVDWVISLQLVRMNQELVSTC
jgi:hypothetical protein